MTLRVLIVEDEEMIRCGLVDTIDWQGMQCMVAGVAATGTEHYHRNANQNHYEVPFHASQNGCNPKVYK